MAAALLATKIARCNRILAGVKLAFGPQFQGSDLADFSRPNAIRWLRALIGNSTSAAARSDGYRGTWHSSAVLDNIRTMLLTWLRSTCGDSSSSIRRRGTAPTCGHLLLRLKR